MPVDHFGTPFRVSHVVMGNTQTITATSAGPDRLFGTADDITESRSFPLKP
jgi:hypothetical protein